MEVVDQQNNESVYFTTNRNRQTNFRTNQWTDPEVLSRDSGNHLAVTFNDFKEDLITYMQIHWVCLCDWSCQVPVQCLFLYD